MNTELDHYFQGKDVSTKTDLGFEIKEHILDIEVCRAMHIPYAQNINELEVQDYRFISLFLEKEKFYKRKQNPLPS